MFYKIDTRKKELKFLLTLSLIIALLWSLGFSEVSANTEVILQKAPIDQKDPASLQRGAKIFMNHCSGCHGLKYMRYKSMAKGIGILDKNGKVLDQIVRDELMFVGDKIEDPILTSLSVKDGKNWFGVAPPDLSLVARSRGVDWLYAYLRAFYEDPKKPWGVNNHVFPDVAMPHVLYNMQKSMSTTEYDAYIADLVNFLNYVGEPIQLERERLGVWVLLFLIAFFVLTVLLKREYWKNIE